MKKLIILFSLLTIIRFISYAQIKINNRTNARVFDSSKSLNPNLKSIQPGQTGSTTRNTVPGVKTLYYSIEPTAFSGSWGIQLSKKNANSLVSFIHKFRQKFPGQKSNFYQQKSAI